jgi:protein TonB
LKRILLALLLALGFHGILFGIEFDWLHKKPLSRPRARTLTMSLGYLEPQKPKPKPVIIKPESPPKKIVLPKKKVKKKKPEPIIKPEPKKEVVRAPAIIKKDVAPHKKEPSKLQPSFEIKDAELAKEEPDGLSAEVARDTKGEEVSMAVDKGVLSSELPAVREAKPLYRINPPPSYPKIARRRGYEGTVILEVLVDRNGKVGDLRVSKSSGYRILDRAATASVKDWVFEPGKKGNQNVEMRVKVPIRFQLD